MNLHSLSERNIMKHMRTQTMTRYQNKITELTLNVVFNGVFSSLLFLI